MLDFKGRIEREDWIGQARALIAEATAGEGRELAQRGLGDVRGLLDEVGGTTATSEYGSSSSAARPDALLVDRRA